MKTKLGVKILFIILIFCWTILLLAVFDGLNNLIVKPFIIDETPQKSDVIIILGGGVDKDIKEINTQAQKRVDRGVELWLNGYASYIILSGGLVKNTSYTEADGLMEYAQGKNIPINKIFREKQSTDTYTNAFFSQEIMKQKNWQTALVVTSDYHTKRACKVFRKLKINVKCIASSVPQEKLYQKLENFKSIVREYGATVYYWLRGRI